MATALRLDPCDPLSDRRRRSCSSWRRSSTFFAFFTILFTKKYPEGMFKIALVGLRWQARGNAYAYWLITKYPPFVWA